jgi:hypothetical protein
MQQRPATASRSASVAAIDAVRCSPGRRAYGTGTLRVVGGSWLASWYGPDGRRVQRKVGAVRIEGRADGLTKAQAERVLRRMREIDSPRLAPDGRRVTMEQAGDESAGASSCAAAASRTG